jgi:murein DD-endopeptidase MepM/ murein hydrolase activator NlpD
LQYLIRLVTLIRIRGTLIGKTKPMAVGKLVSVGPFGSQGTRGIMIGNLMQKGAWRLPDIRPVAQPISTVLESIRNRRQQVLLASVAGVAVAAVAFTTIGYVQHRHSAAQAQIAASRIETANVDLQDQLARLRDQIAASNRDLAAAQSRVVALTDEIHEHAQPQSTTPTAETATVPAKGDKAGAQLSQQLHVAEAQRATLAARLSKAEADLAEQQAKQADLLSQIDQWQKKFEQLTSDRDRLKARVGELEKQSALKHAQATVAQAQPAPPAAVPQPQPAVAQAQPVQAEAVQAPPVQAQPALAEAPQRVAGILNAPPPATAPAAPVVSAPAMVASAAAAVVSAPVVVGHTAVDQFARVLASAGVDVRHLFSEYGVNRDEGGPFIPAPHGQVPADTLTPQKLTALQAMVKTLPVAVPMEGRVTSPFGEREDPFNGRAAFHPGIDIAAPQGTPIYATAPGVVTFSGYRSDYGKIVEIDHGHGIVTRYGHLTRCSVNVGEHVATGTEIGLEGSTGRSTGPHVIYEIDVNGEPQDPEKFFALSRYVQSASARE